METPEGFEGNFALFHLSRFLLSHGLVELLGRAEGGTVLDFGGSGLTGPVRRNGLQLRRNHPGTGALGHSGALCDLLGVHFSRVHRDTPICHLLNHPGAASTGFAGECFNCAAAPVGRSA